jgi:zinc protease
MLGGSGLVSMLSEQVREKRGLAYSVYSYFSQMQNKGPFVFNAQTRTDRAHETLDVIRQTLEGFMKEGPDEERLTAARKNITGSFPLQTSSNANIVEYIAMMGFYDYPLDYLDTFVDKVNAVTAEDIRDAFRRRVNPETFLVVTVGKNGT